MPSNTPNTLVNLGNLSKRADTLIKKASKAVGGLFAPYQLRRVAKAEAEAALIKAQSEIEITDLHRRAMNRRMEEEAQRQKNMEAITDKALPQLNESANLDSIEYDWLVNFFDKCRIVSDTDMQALWSRVLAGESNTPGTYSRRTVNFLSDLGKDEATLFTKLCGFGWEIGEIIPLVFDEKADIYKRHGINFSSLSGLDSIGLIQFNALNNLFKEGLRQKVLVHYYGKPLLLEMPRYTDNELVIGQALLTRIGQELAPICGSKPVEGFWEYVKNQWKEYLPETGRDGE